LKPVCLFFQSIFKPLCPRNCRIFNTGALHDTRDGTRPAQRTGQQPARARKTAKSSSQNRMSRITVVCLLSGIVNRCTLIRKQKMFRSWVQGYWKWAQGYLCGLEKNGKPNCTADVGGSCFQAGKKCSGARPPKSRGVRVLCRVRRSDEGWGNAADDHVGRPVPLRGAPRRGKNLTWLRTLAGCAPGHQPQSLMIAMASISISASGLTSAFTTTPVAAGKPFLKYFLRTAAVSSYRSRVVT
jgi:hypothetical protein